MSVVEDLSASVALAIRAAIDPLKRRIEVLEIRTTALDGVLDLKRELADRIADLAEFKDAGAWNGATDYHPNNFVSFQGSMWIAKKHSRNIRPGTSDHW